MTYGLSQHVLMPEHGSVKQSRPFCCTRLVGGQGATRQMSNFWVFWLSAGLTMVCSRQGKPETLELEETP